MSIVHFSEAKAESRERTIQIALQLVIDSRNLSHGSVSAEMASQLKTRAIELMDERQTLSTGELVCELFKLVRGNVKTRSRPRAEKPVADREINVAAGLVEDASG